MSSSRPRRAVPSALNSAVIAHVTGIKSVDQARAEAILTKFISTSEAIATSGTEEQIAFSKIGMSTVSGSNPVLGQLKRVQRDLRGLPPLSAELDTFKRPAESSGEEQAPQNKKIKFSDDDAEADSGDVSVDNTAEVNETEESVEEEEKQPEQEEEQEQEDDASEEAEKLEKKKQRKLAKKEKKEKKKSKESKD